MPHQTVIISSDLSKARRLEDRLVREVAGRGYGETDVFAIKLTLEEAFVNSIKHGNKFDAGKHVSVTWEITDHHAEFTIADEGEGFVPEAVPDPTCDENLERPCGRGLMLIRAYMDKITFSDRGNRIQVLKIKETG